VSLAARDGVRYPVFDAAITQLMQQWDAASVGNKAKTAS